MNEQGDLVMLFQEHASGMVSVNVNAFDGQELTILTFEVFVPEVNDAPTLTREIQEVVVNEDPSPIRIVLEEHFTDIDDDTLTFTATLIGSRNMSLTIGIQESMDGPGSELVCEPWPDEHGYAQIRVNADDNRGGTAEAILRIKVRAVNDAPRLRGQIMDYIFNEKESSKTVDFEGSLFDPDGDALSYTLKDENGDMSNTVSSTFISGTLVPGTQQVSVEVRPYQTKGGTSHFAVCAFDPSNEFKCAEFNVTIIAVSDQITEHRLLPDVVRLEDSGPVQVQLLDHFSDADHRPDTLTFSASTFDNRMLQVAVVNTSVLVLKLLPDAYGRGQVNVLVKNPRGDQLVSRFQVDVQATADPPEAFDVSFSLTTASYASAILHSRDIDGDLVKFIIVSQPKCGSVMIENPTSATVSTGTLTYVPEWSLMDKCQQGSKRRDIIGFVAEKNAGPFMGVRSLEKKAIVEIELRRTPRARSAEIYTIQEQTVSGSLVTYVADQMGLTFSFDDHKWAFKLKTPPDHSKGSVTIDTNDGSIIFSPANGFYGDASFVWHVTVSGVQSNDAMMTVKISKINHPPVATSIEVQVAAASTKQVMLVAEDRDQDNRLLEFSGLTECGLAEGRGYVSFEPTQPFCRREAGPG